MARAWTAFLRTPQKRLYRNNRDGTFADIAEKSGLNRTGWASAVAVGGFNNDGFEDLFITYLGRGATLSIATTVMEGLPTSPERPTCSALVTVGGQVVELHFHRLQSRGVAGPLRCELSGVRSEVAPQGRRRQLLQLEGCPVNCGPRGLPPGSVSLFRNNGDGTLRSAT